MQDELARQTKVMQKCCLSYISSLCTSCFLMLYNCCLAEWMPPSLFFSMCMCSPHFSFEHNLALKVKFEDIIYLWSAEHEILVHVLRTVPKKARESNQVWSSDMSTKKTCTSLLYSWFLPYICRRYWWLPNAWNIPKIKPLNKLSPVHLCPPTTMHIVVLETILICRGVQIVKFLNWIKYKHSRKTTSKYWIENWIYLFLNTLKYKDCVEFSWKKNEHYWKYLHCLFTMHVVLFTNKRPVNWGPR